MPDDTTGPLGRATALLLSSIIATGATARLATKGVHEDGLSVVPIGLLPETVVGNPIRMRLRYLVCAGGPAPVALFDQLLSQEQPFLVPEEVPQEIWQSLGIPPRIGLFFDVPVQFDRPVKMAPRVTSLPVLASVSLGKIRGSVVAPGGVPLAGMRIATTDGTSFTHTDTKGHFVLQGVLTEQPTQLIVSGRGLRLAAEVAAAPAEPVVITCEI